MVEVLIHVFEVQNIVVVRPRGAGEAKEEVVIQVVVFRVAVQLLSHGLKQQNQICGLSVVGGPFPIDIQTIKAEIGDKFDRGIGEGCSAGRAGGHGRKGRG